MSVENLPGDDRDRQQDEDEARMQLLITKTVERYERRRRRLAKE